MYLLPTFFTDEIYYEYEPSGFSGSVEYQDVEAEGEDYYYDPPDAVADVENFKLQNDNRAAQTNISTFDKADRKIDTENGFDEAMLSSDCCKLV